MNSLVILAAGDGKRAKQDIPKQFVIIDENSGKRVINLHLPIIKSKNFDFHEIVVVVPNSWFVTIKKELKKICPIAKVIIGGSNRSKSAAIGIKACSKKCENVLIHDGARPFASANLYKLCIEKLKNNDAVIPLTDSVDSSVYFQNSYEDSNPTYLKREYLKFIQTPQAFKYKLISQAYANLEIEKTDDLQILLTYNDKSKICFIDGDSANFKITTKKDVELVMSLIKNHDKEVESI